MIEQASSLAGRKLSLEDAEALLTFVDPVTRELRAEKPAPSRFARVCGNIRKWFSAD